MKFHKVSFLIAAFNEEEYLRECIESCLRQEGIDVEVCVVDDGSSDGTRHVISSFSGDARVKYDYFSANRGKVSAFNRAFEMSTGDYVFLVGADDVSDSQRALTSISKLVDSNSDFLYADYYVCDESLKVLRVNKSSSSISSVSLSFNNRISGGTVAMTRRFCDFSFPIPSVLKFEDWWLAFIAVTKFKFVYLPHPVLFYRHHSSNDSVDNAVFFGAMTKDYKRHAAYYDELELYVKKNLIGRSDLIDALRDSRFFKGVYIESSFLCRLKLLFSFFETYKRMPRTRYGLIAMFMVLPGFSGFFDVLLFAKKKFRNLKVGNYDNESKG